jgi:exopolysaccharide biosynthesis polyprenyl glycosylphosphotransferase
MRRHDTTDVLMSAVAVGADAVAIFGAFMAAVWLRFDSGWIPLFHDRPPVHIYSFYGLGALLATLLFLFIFRAMGLYIRPQVGLFSDKVPRLIRGVGVGILFTTALAFAIRTEPPFSRLTVALAAAVILDFMLIERYLLFRWELHLARHSTSRHRTLILGTGDVADRLARNIRREPRLRTQVLGFVQLDEVPLSPGIKPEQVLGKLGELEHLIETHQADRVILAGAQPGHERMVEIVLLCQKNLVTFNLVPDLFQILMGSMDVQMVDDIPLLGGSRWPLDYFWNRLLKRMEDVCGAVVGLMLSAPILILAAVAIKLSSPGSVFYCQKRCGERGRRFSLYKLRTMQVDAEKETGPVWTVENDPRRTSLGAFLRRYNLDELPQFWNVLRGDMSLVGPRPERPEFVEQFREEIDRYMARHVSKPGLTGWAQVNGLRGNTSIEERIRYDLYYLENWSLSFDFKIIFKTFFTNQNAY